MPDRSTKTTMGTEDMHERKVSVEPQDSHQDAQPRGMFHNIKVCTGRAGQDRQGRTGQGRARQGRAGQGRDHPAQLGTPDQVSAFSLLLLRMSL